MKKKISDNFFAVLLVIIFMFCVIFSIIVRNYVSAKTKITISSKSITLQKGQTKQLSLQGVGKNKKKITWKSSKKTVATVTKTGKVKAKSPGAAKITAKYKGKNYICRVTVKRKEDMKNTPKPSVKPSPSQDVLYPQTTALAPHNSVTDYVPDVTEKETILLYEKDNIPAVTVYYNTGSSTQDPEGFIPNMTFIPVKKGIQIKGAVLICAGGAFQFRSDEAEGYSVANTLSEMGYQSFVVDYRIRPYTQEEGALDLARAVRFVRMHAAEYGIHENNIAVMGFSAGGILCGEMLLNYDGLVNGTALDSGYIPDALDLVSADASAVGMIYSFYGRLSVASTDTEKFASSNLPPAYFCYGTRDSFVNQFAKCAEALQTVSIPTEVNVLQDMPHGYGSTGGWMEDYDRWLTKIFQNNDSKQSENEKCEKVTAQTKVMDVINYPVFSGYGRLLFPVDYSISPNLTLDQIGSLMPYHNYINTDKTVEIVNTMLKKSASGETIFYDIYTEEEKKADSDKKNTGLFFFCGNAKAKFAIVNAGGGFSYVGAMHESFPHALELSKKGYNAFALIYRSGGAQPACEDLARAIRFIFDHAEELQVDTDCYSLWGGSAGARMAAYLGSYGTAGYGEIELPYPGTVIMQYTGHGDYTKNDPPTFACVGSNDGIASPRIMKARLDAMSDLGIDTEFHEYPDLRHGFGLGIGTSAEGWLDTAVGFWEKQMSDGR